MNNAFYVIAFTDDKGKGSPFFWAVPATRFLIVLQILFLNVRFSLFKVIHARSNITLNGPAIQNSNRNVILKIFGLFPPICKYKV